LITNPQPLKTKTMYDLLTFDSAKKLFENPEKVKLEMFSNLETKTTHIGFCLNRQGRADHVWNWFRFFSDSRRYLFFDHTYSTNTGCITKSNSRARSCEAMFNKLLN